MPYTASTFFLPRDREEDQVEELVGGEPAEVQQPPNGLHWAMRNHGHDILVQPPTPERGDLPSPASYPTVPPPSSSPLRSTFETSSDASGSSNTRENSPSLPITSIPGSKAHFPIQVLPEVRSPPRRMLPMTDSPQQRGRRARIFGFTDIQDRSSGSSTNTSANNSRSNSPERQVYGSIQLSLAPSNPVTNGHSPLMDRSPVRVASDTSLSTRVPQHAHTFHHPPRRRDTGLKLDFSNIVPLTTTHAEQVVSSVPSPYSAQLIRKKSGEILKSALKQQSQSTTPLGDEMARFLSKSAPTTPSGAKYVHWDAVDKVKHYLPDQKPEAVSRDGSPLQETTDEGEEYPFPSTDEERESKRLQITTPNFPAFTSPNSDLYLERLFLDEDGKSIKGFVICKNLAFQKWVAVRFTLDWWQTTSEVSATYKESMREGQFDRFAFSIKLNDFISRIEEKTLFLAIRYNTDGREIWDSNGGANYQVLFQRSQQQRTFFSTRGGARSAGSRTRRDSDDSIADLRDRLSRLTSGEESSPEPPVVAPMNRHRSFQGSTKLSYGAPVGVTPRRSVSQTDRRPDTLPKIKGAFSTRYNFGDAIKEEKQRRNSSSPSMTNRELPDIRTGLLQYGGRVNNAHGSTEFYSPKLANSSLPEGEHFFSPSSPAEIPSPSTIPLPQVSIQGPSPPPDIDSPTPAPGSKPGSRRPSLSRSQTAPVYTTPSLLSPHHSPVTASFPVQQLPETASDSSSSPPQLLVSSNSDTPSGSPKSPPEPNNSLPDSNWSTLVRSDTESDFSDLDPDEQRKRMADLSRAMYETYVQKFCWATSPPLSEGRRSHSTTSLDQLSQSQSSPSHSIHVHSPYHPSSGLSTPRAGPHPSAGVRSPGTDSTYSYSSTSTPTTKDGVRSRPDSDSELLTPKPRRGDRAPVTQSLDQIRGAFATGHGQANGNLGNITPRSRFGDVTPPASVAAL